MADVFAFVSLALTIALAAVLFDIAALTCGEDSRESYGDDHRRPAGGSI